MKIFDRDGSTYRWRQVPNLDESWNLEVYEPGYLGFSAPADRCYETHTSWRPLACAWFIGSFGWNGALMEREIGPFGHEATEERWNRFSKEEIFAELEKAAIGRSHG